MQLYKDGWLQSHTAKIYNLNFHFNSLCTQMEKLFCLIEAEATDGTGSQLNKGWILTIPEILVCLKIIWSCALCSQWTGIHIMRNTAIIGTKYNSQERGQTQSWRLKYFTLSQELICHSIPAASVQPVSTAGTSAALGTRQTFKRLQNQNCSKVLQNQNVWLLPSDSLLHCETCLLLDVRSKAGPEKRTRGSCCVYLLNHLV